MPKNKIFLGARYISLALFFILFVFGLAKNASASEENSIFINEIMWQGRSEKIADEWLELYNNSDEIVDLKGFSITDEIKPKEGPDVKPLVLIEEGQIAPHGFFLISKNKKDFTYNGKESYLNVEPDLVSSKLSLSNEKLKIALRGPDDEKIDLVGGIDTDNDDLDDDWEPYQPVGCAANYCSLQRIDYSQNSGKQIASWIPSSERMYPSATDDPIDSDNIIINGTPTPSGRPNVIDFSLSSESYELNVQKTFSLNYDVEDTDDDFERIEIEAVAKGDKFEKKLKPGQHSFTLPASKNCWEIKINFIDAKGLSEEKTQELKCFQKNKQIYFSEVLTAPKDKDWDSDGEENSHDEWFELENKSDQNCEMSGWKVSDLSGKSAEISGKISAGGFLVFYFKDTNISLNNSGESLSLYDPNGELIDKVEIPSLSYNESYSKVAGVWKKSQKPTPGLANIFTEKENSTNETSGVNSVKSSSVKKTLPPLSGEDVEEEIEPTIKITVVRKIIIPATLASFKTTNTRSIRKIEGMVLGSSTERSKYSFKVNHNLLYFFSIMALAITSTIFIFNLNAIYRRE